MKVPDWTMDVEHAMACNCNWGCPCGFESPPTYGTCEAALIWRVREGNYGEIRLDGATWVAAIAWPGPLHEGGGQAVVFIDEAMPKEQQLPIEMIASGHAGGAMKWFMGTVTAGIEIRHAPIHVEFDGKRTSFAVGPGLAVEFESIKNPVTGEEHSIKTVIETGLLHPVEEHFSARRLDVDVGPIRFSYASRNAFLNRTTWFGPDPRPPEATTKKVG